MNKIILVALSTISLPLMTEANINTELNNFYTSLGSTTNSNSAAIYEGQKAGYATGGGVMVRNRVMNSNIATVNLPKFDAGCGGIDIYTGGFSFINNEQLITTLKSIASSASGYAFMLGLETVSPQISNNIKQLQSWANHINSLGINSCDHATGLVGSIWPRNTAASQHICRTANTTGKVYNNYIEARHNCANMNRRERAADQEKSNILGEEFNVAWVAIKKHEFLSKNQNLSELFMTLTGTYVIKESDGEMVGAYYPSKVTNESFLKTLLEGGDTLVYHCKDSKQCFNIEETKLTISPEDAWIGKVRTTLLEIQNKILSDNELNENEIAFISGSHLPLYRIVNVMSAYKGGNCPVDLYQVSEIVAMDMLTQYLREVLNLAREGCQNTKLSQLYSFNLDDYIQELTRLEEWVRKYEMRSAEKMEQEFHLMQKIQVIEEKIAAEIVL